MFWKENVPKEFFQQNVEKGIFSTKCGKVGTRPASTGSLVKILMGSFEPSYVLKQNNATIIWGVLLKKL